MLANPMATPRSGKRLRLEQPGADRRPGVLLRCCLPTPSPSSPTFRPTEFDGSWVPCVTCTDPARTLSIHVHTTTSTVVLLPSSSACSGERVSVLCRLASYVTVLPLHRSSFLVSTPDWPAAMAICERLMLPYSSRGVSERVCGATQRRQASPVPVRAPSQQRATPTLLECRSVDRTKSSRLHAFRPEGAPLCAPLRTWPSF